MKDTYQSREREGFLEIANYLPLIAKEARRLSRSDPFTRDDLTQEGFMAAWCALSSYDPKRGTLSGYIRTCSRNRMISYLRRNRREAPVDEELLNTGIDRMDLSSYPCGQQERIERREAIDSLFDRLSDFEQLVLGAYLREGSLSRVAVALGCDRKRVDNALQRIRVKARRIV